MVVFALVALIGGVLCGCFIEQNAFFTWLSANSDIILNLLMITVGISIGQQRGIFQKIRQYHVKLLLIPLGVMIGSIAGGWLCAIVTRYPLAEGMAIASCMGWYSLGGVTIEVLSGAMYGSVAFLGSLMREILSFFCIPLIAKYMNPAACIAAAGATSEDTTLPMMMKYTDEESVVLSVLNGTICSVFVPVLISVIYKLFG